MSSIQNKTKSNFKKTISQKPEIIAVVIVVIIAVIATVASNW